MATRFAGILALVAFITACIRGLLAGADFEATLRQACVSLWVYGGIGILLGALAQRAIEESIQTKRNAHREVGPGASNADPVGRQSDAPNNTSS